MNRWVLLEHKVYSGNSVLMHYDFLVEDEIDCLTWKFLKLPLSKQNSVDVVRQPNHRLVWLFREEYELSRNRGFVKRIDHGIFKKVSDDLESENYQFFLEGELLNGLFEIVGNSCRLINNN